MSNEDPSSNAEQEHHSPSQTGYAGRWVARLRDRVIAQGGTPEQALRAAQTTRHKEVPEVTFVPLTPPLIFPSLLDDVQRVLPPDLPIYLVGGAVRDMLLRRVTLRPTQGGAHDLDFAVPQGGIRLARKVADALEAEFFVLDEERDTGRVVLIRADGSRDLLDFASYRGSDPSTGSGGSLEADLFARDFTINAMAVDVRTRALLDPLGGAADLRHKRLRACSQTSFLDDPIRILRAVRQAATFDLHITSETRQAMRTAVKRLPDTSPERQRDEIFHILEGRQPATALQALEILGAFPALLPELPALKGFEQPKPHVYDVWEHTLAVIRNLESLLAALAPEYNPDSTSDVFTGILMLRLGRYRGQFALHFATTLNKDRSLRGLLFLAALYHDVAKPFSRTTDENGRLRFWGHDRLGAKMVVQRAQAFHLSNPEIGRLEAIVGNHMRPHYHTSRMAGEGKRPSRRALYRFFRDAGPAGVDIVLLGLADLRATYGANLTQEEWAAGLEVARIFLENWWEKPEETVAPTSLVNGYTVMKAYDLTPGPRVGQVLEAIREGQATGKISTPEEALDFGRVWLEENPAEEPKESF
jgi:poly(A) polymerase